MNEDRQAILKKHHDKYNFHKLLYTKAKIPENYFNPKTLVTRDIIHAKIEKIINCSNLNMQSQDIDCETGELSPFSLYNSLCGVYVVCPVCARVRGEMIWKKYSDRVNSMHKKYRYAYSLTFTLENISKFEDMYSLMNGSLSRFFKQGQKRGVFGQRSGGESSKIKAAIASIEVKTGKGSNKAHVHLHMLAFTDIKFNYVIYDQKKKAILQQVYPVRIPKHKLEEIATELMDYRGKKIATSKLRTEWYTASFGNSVNINCRMLKNNENIKKALIEVVKYPIKTNHMDERLFMDVLLNRDNKRFLRIYGEMINRNKMDETITTVDEEEKDIITHSIDVRVYDPEKENFTNGTEDQFELAHKLNGKREELKKYFSVCSDIRKYERYLLEPIKMKLALYKQMPEDIADNIKQRNAIYIAWKQYLKKAYRKMLKIQNIKTYRKGNRKLTKLEKYYYNMFKKNVIIPNPQKK